MTNLAQCKKRSQREPGGKVAWIAAILPENTMTCEGVPDKKQGVWHFRATVRRDCAVALKGLKPV